MFSELRDREVISAVTGDRIGYIDDLRINTEKCRIDSFIIYGRPRFFGLLGREEDIFINWDSVVLIGTDAVLVKTNEELVRVNKVGHKSLYD